MSSIKKNKSKKETQNVHTRRGWLERKEQAKEKERIVRKEEKNQSSAWCPRNLEKKVFLKQRTFDSGKYSWKGTYGIVHMKASSALPGTR